MTPRQLFISGMMRIAGSSHTIAKEMFEDLRDVRTQKYLHVHLLNKLGSQWQQNCGTSKEPKEV